jgi:hypothetical protein
MSHESFFLLVKTLTEMKAREHMCLHKIQFKKITFLLTMLKRKKKSKYLLFCCIRFGPCERRKTQFVCIFVLYRAPSRLKRTCIERRIKNVKTCFFFSFSWLFTMKKISEKGKCIKLVAHTLCKTQKRLFRFSDCIKCNMCHMKSHEY